MFWTQKKMDELTALVESQSLTYSQIAARLGCTKSMTIGKVSRLGLQKKQNPNLQRGNKDVVSTITGMHKQFPNRRKTTVNALRLVCTDGAMISSVHTCQWIFGESSERNFCGKPSLVWSSAWCPEHYAVVYIKTPRAERRM